MTARVPPDDDRSNYRMAKEVLFDPLQDAMTARGPPDPGRAGPRAVGRRLRAGAP